MSALAWATIGLIALFFYNHLIVHNPSDPFNQDDHIEEQPKWNTKSHNKVHDQDNT